MHDQPWQRPTPRPHAAHLQAQLVALTADLVARRPASVAMSAPLVDLVAAHGLAGRVQGARPHGESAALVQLAGRARATALRSMQVASTACRVSEAMQQAQIDALVYKGIPLSVQVDEPVAERLAGDVDVLVRGSAIDAVSDLLTNLGYRARRRHPHVPLAAEDALHIERTFDGAGPSVDLHWAITWPSAYRASFDDLWNRRSQVAVGTSMVWTLDPVDALLVTAVHGTRSGWSRWQWLVDAGRQYRALSAGELMAARERAAVARCQRALAVTVAMLDHIGAVDPPASVVPGRTARRLGAEALQATVLRPEVGRGLAEAVRRQRWRWQTSDHADAALAVVAAAAGRQVLRRSHARWRPAEGRG